MCSVGMGEMGHSFEIWDLAMVPANAKGVKCGRGMTLEEINPALLELSITFLSYAWAPFWWGGGWKRCAMVEKLACIEVWVLCPCTTSRISFLREDCSERAHSTEGRPWLVRTSASAKEPLDSRPTPVLQHPQYQQSQLTHTNAQWEERQR